MAEEKWRIVAASAIGTSHLTSGLPCQDYIAHSEIISSDGNVFIGIVCDGAGSAVHAEIGASVSAISLLQLVSHHFSTGRTLNDIDRAKASEWIEAISCALEEKAQQSSHSVREYACTLLAAIVGENSAVFIQVGDGAIVVADSDGEGWTWVFWPQHGEFANTTNFLVSPNVTALVEFDFCAGRINEIAMFSDGIENLVLHKAARTVHAAFFDTMFPPVRRAMRGFDRSLSASLEKYLLSPLICEKTDDDKSLILASRQDVDIGVGEKCERRP